MNEITLACQHFEKLLQEQLERLKSMDKPVKDFSKMDTTTIGIRRMLMERTVLPREEVSVETPYGTALAKRVVLPDGEVRMYPEYTSVAALARVSDAGYQTVYQAVIAAIQG